MRTDVPPLNDPAEITVPKLMRHFPDEASAIEYFERIRWAKGIVCPHCGNKDQGKFWKIEANAEKKIRPGLRQCAECKKQFRVTVGTIFEDSHFPLNLWLIAWYLMCGAKKGISAKQLQRHLGIGSYKCAWHMAHRIRHAMADPVFEGKLTGTVEVDECYIGGKNLGKGCMHSLDNKTPVVSLVQRGGQKRSVIVPKVTAKNLRAAVIEHVAAGSVVHTDEHRGYKNLKDKFQHGSVNHARYEYVRKFKDGRTITTNEVESSFALLKRGVMGSFHHVSKKHLPRYLAEFDFRWNHRKSTDGQRTVAALKKAEGKRLAYKQPKEPAA